jgi:hypothetical protein
VTDPGDETVLGNGWSLAASRRFAPHSPVEGCELLCGGGRDPPHQKTVASEIDRGEIMKVKRFSFATALATCEGVAAQDLRDARQGA